MPLLFSPTSVKSLALQNRLVMAPMTRSRAIGNIPNELMAEYYAQRASLGLLITEGTSPSPNGLGYARIPGMYSAAQTAGWKLVTSAVHAKGAKIFVQLMHCGRIAHPLNMPQGARILAPSALAAAGQMWTDAQGMQAQPVPEAMTEADLKHAIDEYVLSAKNAMAAGFDGIELHAANGYLLEQFIRPNTNQRSDGYGGSIEGRSRLVLEIADALIATVGKDKVGIRISPFGVYNDMPLYPQMEADYTYLARQLNERGLLYIHLVDHSSMGAPAIPESIPTMLRSMSNCALILSGGYNFQRAESDLTSGRCDLVAVGRPCLANPDLIERWAAGAAENAPDPSTFYTSGAQGYTDYRDYPTLG